MQSPLRDILYLLPQDGSMQLNLLLDAILKSPHAAQVPSFSMYSLFPHAG